MNLPTHFKIGNQQIRVEVVEETENHEYGNWCDTTNVITIATHIDGIALSKEQILNTLWHEVFHAFCFFYNNDKDEALAQCFANFMREYESTAQYQEYEISTNK